MASYKPMGKSGFRYAGGDHWTAGGRMSPQDYQQSVDRGQQFNQQYQQNPNSAQYGSNPWLANRNMGGYPQAGDQGYNQDWHDWWGRYYDKIQQHDPSYKPPQQFTNYGQQPSAPTGPNMAQLTLQNMYGNGGSV